MAALPAIPDPAAFSGSLRHTDSWRPAIDAIAGRHGLSGRFEPSRDGSTVVFLSARWCIKLFPPLAGFLASEQREATSLEAIGGRLPIATPVIEERDQLEGWPYLVTTRIPGVAIDRVWADLDSATRQALAVELGAALRAMHDLDGAHLAAITEPWSTFRPAQRGRCLSRERDKGLSAPRLAQLEAYLDRLDRIPEPQAKPAILHTEVGPSHVLVEGDRIGGLIDFGDAMVGDPEYDLAPVGMFVTRGDRHALGALCRAYGLADDDLADPQRPHRLLRHALLHRYGTLAWYLRTLRPPMSDPDGLAAHWFGVA